MTFFRELWHFHTIICKKVINLKCNTRNEFGLSIILWNGLSVSIETCVCFCLHALLFILEQERDKNALSPISREKWGILHYSMLIVVKVTYIIFTILYMHCFVRIISFPYCSVNIQYRSRFWLVKNQDDWSVIFRRALFYIY